MTAPDRGDLADETPRASSSREAHQRTSSAVPDDYGDEREQTSPGRMGMIDRDEAFYRRSAEDRDTNAMVELGALLHERGQSDEAEEWLRRAAAGRNAQAMLFFGILRFRRGDISAAEQQYDRLLDITGRDERTAYPLPELYYQVGVLSEEQGDLEGAEKWFGYAAQDGHPRAMFALATLFRQQGSLLEAETWLRRGAGCGDDAAMCELAVLLRERGEHEEAEQWFNQSARRSASPFGGARAATRSGTGPTPSCRAHQDEIAQFYVSVQQALHAYARRGATDISDAADIVQDAMIRLLHGWERFRVLPHDELVAIALASVRYSWLDRRREHYRGARHSVEVPVDYLAQIGDPAAVEGYEGMIAEETAQKALRILPLRQREIVARVIQGQTIAMIAEELDMNAATVRRLLQRARARIADELEVRPRRSRGDSTPS
ncbi:sigma-70 family RNA polymerase sigma factor [Nocardia fluminea]|uniref:sigma-70 family RNA polymerase sigma factor n=1 Tax=Nocardia fluminea TaxID=134984 RepID=UPI003D0F977C